jgi:hypothetical protein
MFHAPRNVRDILASYHEVSTLSNPIYLPA